MAEHPRLIYATATGFGSTGPYASDPGQDLILQAMSGLAAHTGTADGPPVAVGSVIIDHHAAALYTMGILGALFKRERSGKGGRDEVNLLQAALDLQGESIFAWLNGAPRTGPRGPAGAAGWFSAGGYGIYATADGHVAISMSKPSQLGMALGATRLKQIDENDQFAKREEIAAIVADAMSRLTTGEAVSQLGAANIWHAVVETYDALPDNPQLQHLAAFTTVAGASGEPVTFLSHPVRYDGVAPPVETVPQPLGAQSREILSEVGYAAAAIDALDSDGVIRCGEPTGPDR